MGSPAFVTLEQMRGALGRLDGSQFAPQAYSLGTRLAEIKTQAERLVPSLGPLEEADFGITVLGLAEVLPGATSGVLLAAEGFRDGDIYSGVQGLMDMCASTVPLIGAAVGAAIGGIPTGGIGAAPGAGAGFLIASLVGSIFSMIGEVLGFFAPKTESLAEQIRTLLEEQDIDRVQSDIRMVHRAFLVYASALGEQCASMVDPKTGLDSPSFQPAVAARVIDRLNLVDGVSMSTYWKVIDWLANPKHHEQREWPLVLDAACNAYTSLLIAVVRITSLVNSERMFQKYRAADENGRRELHDLWVAATAQLRIYASSQKMDLDQLRRLTPVVQNRGSLWRITRNLEVGIIDPNISPVHHGGGFEFRTMSVTVCSNDQAAPEPVYRFYGTDMGNRLNLWTVASYQSGSKKVADWVTKTQVLGNAELDDVFAISGTDLTMNNHACVYELSKGGLKFEGKYRDEDGKEIKTICTFPFHESTLRDFAITRMTSIRAVNEPYAYAEDPSNSHLKGCKYIVYALEGSGSRVISLLNGQILIFAASPFAQTRGIAVDQDYLWTFTDTEFACATHASIIHKARTNASLDMWIRCKDIPVAAGIHSLYSCDDGTIVAIVKDTFDVYSASYRVDLRKHTLAAYDGNNPVRWTKIGDRRAQGLEKLPVFCWPQFESLRETLEDMQKLFVRGKAAGN